MPTLEPVCKRLFSSQSSLLKCVLAGLLLIVPIGHFLAFGFLYALIDQARRGADLEFPSWSGWRRLFIDGVVAFVIFSVLGVVPIFVGWMLSWPLRSLEVGVTLPAAMSFWWWILGWPLHSLGVGALTYVPLIPGVLLAAPLTAAGIYEYQKGKGFRAAFDLSELAGMLESTRAGFCVPTLALLGFVVVGYPLMPVTLFMGLAVAFSFYAAFFRALEESRKGGTRSP